MIHSEKQTENRFSKILFRISNKPNAFSIFFLFFLLLSLIISTISLCSVPPISRDALIHHLAVPKLYLQHGGIYEIPYMPYSYYPMNLDLLYLIPLYMGNDIFPKYIHYLFALLTAFWIFYYLFSRINFFYGFFGALFFLSVPIILKLSITAYVDLGLIFFSTGALLFLLRWIDENFKTRYLLISAIFCGLALGTKYNGLIVLFVLGMFVPFVYSRYSHEGKSLKDCLSQGLLFVAIVLLIYSPWGIRNIIWKQNPVYPLYNSIFRHSEKKINQGEAEESVKIGNLIKRKYIYDESNWDIVILPLRIFFQGKDGDSQFFDGKMNPFLLILPIMALFPVRKDNPTCLREKKILLFFSILLFIFVFFSTAIRVRYFSPIIPSLVILSAFGLQNFNEAVRICMLKRITLRKVITTVFLLLIFYPNLVYLHDQFHYVQPADFLTGAVDRNGYISRYRFEHPAFLFINHNLPPNVRILLLGLGKRGYYCDREYLPDTLDQLWAFKALIKNSESPQSVQESLNHLKITHLVIHRHYFEKWVQSTIPEYDRVKLRAFFIRYAKIIFSENGVDVFELTNAKSAEL